MKKYLLGFIAGGIIFGSIGFVLADIIINSKDVSYSNEYTTKTNVSDALDELFKQSTGDPAKPVIKGNLVPVIIKDDGSVYKADTSKPWYNYAKKEWANAIELFEGAKYHKGEEDERNYEVGDIIPESDIRSYFVWIPKYRYKLWNVNDDGSSTGAIGPHSIEIEFDVVDTEDVDKVSCKTPMYSNASGNCDNGEWMTHPAFITMGVNGFWVGKFEIGHKDNTVEKAKYPMNKESDAGNIVVKPDYYSWTNTSAVDYFNILLKYNSSLQSHMMKNTEWGAVAYLSHSKYGKDSEININNYLNNETNYHIKTGRSANSNTDQHTYKGKYGIDINSLWNTPNGYLASTTGNTTGIYDMNGGAHEIMAAFRTGSISLGSDNSKFYDEYGESSDTQDYKYRILGDATGEMGPFKNYKDGDGIFRDHNWYGDNSYFVVSSSQWFGRGGSSNIGVIAGIFNFGYDNGSAQAACGSRLVLAPTI